MSSAVSSLPEMEQPDANAANFLKVFSWVHDADCLVPAPLKEVYVDTTINCIFIPATTPSSSYNLPVSVLKLEGVSGRLVKEFCPTLAFSGASTLTRYFLPKPERKILLCTKVGSVSTGLVPS